MGNDYSETVRLPRETVDIIVSIEKELKAFFKKIKVYPDRGRIEIDGIRYMWANAEALGVSFREILEDQFGTRGTDAIVYSFGKSLGKTEAIRFNEKLNLRDPLKKLLAGPIYFSYSGWALVYPLLLHTIEFNENYIATYRHPNSFEAEVFLKHGKETQRPICFINAGYSAGWCSESIGVPLEARELTCIARGDEHCTFLMTHKDKIDQRIKVYRELANQGKEITQEDLLSV